MDPNRTIPAWRGIVAWLGVLSCLAAPVAADEPTSGGTEVRIERARPPRARLGTLSFLKANRGFVRTMFDRNRVEGVERQSEATTVDPRFLAYAELLRAITASEDSTARVEEARSRRHLYENLAELVELDLQLDALERQLGGQRVRLAELEDDFTGDQRTALVVVLQGLPSGPAPESIFIGLEDGSRTSAPLDEAHRGALARGGIVRVFHRFIEPREQAIEIGLAGDGWTAAASGFVTLLPTRDRITILRLDLSGVSPETGVAAARGRVRLHEAGMASIDG